MSSKKALLVMKLTLMLLAVSILNVNARSYSQTVTFSGTNISLQQVFRAVEKQTGYVFFYDAGILSDTRPATVRAFNMPLEEFLTQVLKNQPLKYLVENKAIIISRKPLDLPPVADAVAEVIPTPPPPEISGVVINDKGEPLAGASVNIKGTGQGTSTGNNGRFTLRAANLTPRSVLVISYIGYQTREIVVGKQTELSVRMTETSRSTEEVVVIGYGSVRKKDLTGAVGSIKSKDVDAHMNTNLGTALQGKVAGLSVSAGDGQPGASVGLRIRGIGTLNNSYPLVLVDGVPIAAIGTYGNYHDALSNINPNDIESIQVLKDASAAAIYGARAANGVLMVTTKSGKKGPVKINASADYGIQNLARKLEVLTTDEWVKVLTEIYKPGGLPLPATALNPPVPGKGTDWQDQIYRKASLQNYAVGATGGSDNLSYSASLGYVNQDGIIKTTGYKRMTMRVKADFTKGRVKIGQTVSVSKEKYNYAPPDGGIVRAGVLDIPAFNVYDSAASGGYAGPGGDILKNDGLRNPLGMLNLTSKANDWLRVTANLYGEVEIIKDLKLKSSIGLTSDENFSQRRWGRYKIGVYWENPRNSNNVSTDFLRQWQVENTLSYNKTISKHSVNAVIGQSALQGEWKGTWSYAEGMPDGIWSLDAAILNRNLGGSSSRNTLASYFGRFNYAYNDRYILTGVFRRDGSSRFGRNNPWGNFPSVSAAWNIGNENFLKNRRTPISDLKIRGGWGKLGNQEIGDYVYVAAISNGLNYANGSSSLWPGSIQINPANQDLKWEATATTNVGLDLGMWNNKLNFTLDVYEKKTTDMILWKQLAVSAGVAGSLPVNVGAMINKGYEMTLTYNGQAKDFTYSATGTFSHATNNVKALSAKTDIFGGGPQYTREGYALNAFWLIQTAGLFRSQTEIDNYKDKDGKLIQPFAKVGDLKFIDANGDGKISDGLVDQGGDRVYVGSTYPAYEYGLRLDASWKFIDLSIYMQGVQGNKIYNDLRANLEAGYAVTNYSKALLNSYTFNTNSDIPRLEFNDQNGNGRGWSDRWLEDGAYFRFRTVQLGFTLPDKFAQRMSVGKTRFYVAGDNLATITKFKGYDPASGGINGGAYPWSRTFHVGLQLNF